MKVHDLGVRPAVGRGSAQGPLLQSRPDRSKKKHVTLSELQWVRIAVVVPAHNEARHIEGVLRTIPSFVDEIIVVDDASEDDTARCVTANLQRDARIRLCRQPINRGVGAAIATGYVEALRLGVDVVAVMAGDGQMDPDDLAPLILAMLRSGADYVKGDRLARPESSRRMPVLRRIGSRVLSRLTSWAAGVSVNDSQCGYTAIRATALGRLDLVSLWPRYGYPNDLIGRVVAAGFCIEEVAVAAIYRDERSGLRVWHVPRIAWLIGRVAWRRIGGSAGAPSDSSLAGRASERLPLRPDEAPCPRPR